MKPGYDSGLLLALIIESIIPWHGGVLRVSLVPLKHSAASCRLWNMFADR